MRAIHFYLISLILSLGFSFKIYSVEYSKQELAYQNCTYRYSYIFQDFSFRLKKGIKKKIFFFSRDDDKKIIENYSKYYQLFQNKKSTIEERVAVLNDNRRIIEKYAANELKACAESINYVQTQIDSKCIKLTSTSPTEKKKLDDCTKNILKDKGATQKGTMGTKAFWELLYKRKTYY